MIVINLKAYSESTDKNAIKLAKICEEVQIETGIRIIVAPSAFDLKEVRQAIKTEVYCQHIDNIEPGAFTGHLTAALARLKGADGTILNHAESKLDWKTLAETAVKAKEEGLGVIMCAENVEYAVEQLKLFPNEIAVEIPELISGNISISKANPEIIKEAVKRVGRDKVLVGAGIKEAEDIKIALKLGAKGVILASAFDLSPTPKEKLLSFAKAFLS